MSERPPGRVVRALVGAGLAVFVVGSLADVEAWPLTGWKLYSNPRGPTTATWRAVVVDGRGVEHNIDFKTLPVAYHQGVNILTDLRTMTRPERQRVCLAFGDVMRRRGADVAGVRLYRVVLAVPTGPEHPPPLRRRVVHACRRAR